MFFVAEWSLSSDSTATRKPIKSLTFITVLINSVDKKKCNFVCGLLLGLYYMRRKLALSLSTIL